MALSAIMVVVSLHMVRIGYSLIVGLMAIPARTWKIAINVVHMTFITSLTDMPSSKWITRRAMIECRWTPDCCAVTWCAVLSKTWRDVPGICRLIELRLVTLLAVVIENQLIVVVDMALRTLRRRMTAC
jgi:hypothetical protein